MNKQDLITQLRFQLEASARAALGARDAAGQVLAADQPTLAVAGVAVGVVRRLTEHADRTRAVVPAQDAVVRDVRQQQVAPVAEPHRALGPAQPGGQLLDAGAVQAQPMEGLVEHLDRGIGIAQRGGEGHGVHLNRPGSQSENAGT